MQKPIKIVALVAGMVLIFFTSFSPGKVTFFDNENSGLKIIFTMLDSIKNIKSMSFQLKSMERVDDKYQTAESTIKLNSSPKMIYFRNDKKKISILWKEGTNNGNALVKARLLLNTTLSLDPYGNMMRKNQHYTIHELGYGFFATTFSSAILKNKDRISKKMVYLGKKTLSDKTCHVVVYDDNDFDYFDYKVGKNESVSSIAIKFTASDFVIRTKNDLHSFYGIIKENKVIKIPNSYCKKVVLFIDEKTMLPVNITNYDDVGLYENYEYTNVVINKKFTVEDFQKFYKD